MGDWAMAGEVSVGNDKIYELIERSRLETKGDMARLEAKFDNLVATRVDKIEDRVNKQDVSMATVLTKLAILGFISASVIGAIIGVLVPRLLR